MVKFLIKRKRKKHIDILNKMKMRLLSHIYSLGWKIKRQTIILKLRKADIILVKPGLFSLSPIALLYRTLLHSKYVHSMLYIGNGKIIHTTTKDGVTIHKVPKKIYKRNRYSIYRARYLNTNQRNRIVNESLKFKDMKMDIMGLVVNIPRKLFGLKKSYLNIEKNRLWCSKLIYQAYSAVGIQLLDECESRIITSESLSKSKFLDIIN